MTDKPKPKEQPRQRIVPCTDCSGRGARAFATEDVRCAACNGKGTVNVQQPNPPDHR